MEILLMTAEKGGPQQEVFRENLLLLSKAQHLKQEGGQTPQEGFLILQQSPGLQIEKRADTAHLITGLQLIEDSGRHIFVE